MYESILSRIPPCPGSNFPESFTSAFLLRNDSNKSPACATIEPIKTIIKNAQIGSPPFKNAL